MLAQRPALAKAQPCPIPRRAGKPGWIRRVYAGTERDHGRLDPGEQRQHLHRLWVRPWRPQACLRRGVTNSIHEHRQTAAAQSYRELTRPARFVGTAQRRAEPWSAPWPQAEAAKVGELAKLVSDPVTPFPVDLVRVLEPDVRTRLSRHPKKRRLHLEWRQSPGLVTLVQRRYVPGEPPVPVDQPPVQVADVRCGRALRLVHRIAQVPGNAQPVLCALVNVEHDLAQAGALKPGQHRVDSSPLLRDEQNLTAARDQRGDEVGDGLALTGARWSVDHQAAAREHGVDGVALGGVGVEHRVIVLGRLRAGRRGLVGTKRLLSIRIASDRGDDVAVAQ